MMNLALLDLAFLPSNHLGLSSKNGVKSNWNKAIADVKKNMYLQPVGLANTNPTKSATKIPITKTNCVIVPNTPRKLGGASSPR
mmetsp:Transcript_23173/g.36235  ORF Transcript_23173/g.36235 Transcript_23173/m.36235 type:complete len:84 (+) Transcript_23173:867-1118(+)